MKVVTTDEMRRIEEACASSGTPMDTLMENAGRAVAEVVQKTLEPLEGKRLLCLVGPGNNGGDGLVAVRYLKDSGASVTVFLAGRRPHMDPNLHLIRDQDITIIEDIDALAAPLSDADAVIDALFGTGRIRPLEGVFRQALEAVTAARQSRPQLHLFALDLPSGLDADTGAADTACPTVDDTITLSFPKVGLFNLPGAAKAGQITVVDIGIDPDLATEVAVDLITDDWVRSQLPARPLLANKGTFGRVLVVAGSERYVGAAILAGSGAIRVGAGLVTLATASSLQPIVAAGLVEATHLPLPEARPGVISPQAVETLNQELDNYQVMLIGCGLGQSPAVVDFVRDTLLGGTASATSLVVDADALNALAPVSEWWRQLPDDAILTPHPGEMSRLAEVSPDDVQWDRVGLARRMAGEWQKTVVLKGAYTVVASPDGRCRINPMVNPGLASAGTGDVLAGAIAGLRGQGLSPEAAAACGVYLHGEAAEIVRDRLGDAGMTASDLLPELPVAIKQLKETAGAGPAGDN